MRRHATSATFGSDSHTHAGRQHLIEMMIRHQRRLREIAEGRKDASQDNVYTGMNTSQRLHRDRAAAAAAAAAAPPPVASSRLLLLRRCLCSLCARLCSARTLDNSTPRSYRSARRSRRGEQRRAAWEATLETHRRLIDRVMTRIAAYPTPTERRANRFDPVAHPVQFKRTQEAGQRGGGEGGGGGGAAAQSRGSSGRTRASVSAVERDVLYSTGATRSQRYYYADPFSSRLKPRQDYDSALLITQQLPDAGRRRRRPGSSSDRPRTAPPATSSSRQKESWQQAAAAAGEEKRREPETAEALQEGSDDDGQEEGGGEGSDAYSRLYCTLVNVLLLHRISRHSAVEALLTRAAAVNDHLDPVKLRCVCEAVRQDCSRRADEEKEEGDQQQQQPSSSWQRGRGEERVVSSDSDDEDEDWESGSEDEQSAVSEQKDGEEAAADALLLRDSDGLPDTAAAGTAEPTDPAVSAGEEGQQAVAEEDEQEEQKEGQEALCGSELTHDAAAAAAVAELVKQPLSPRRQPQTIEEGDEEEQTYESDHEELQEEEQEIAEQELLQHEQ